MKKSMFAVYCCRANRFLSFLGGALGAPGVLGRDDGFGRRGGNGGGRRFFDVFRLCCDLVFFSVFWSGSMTKLPTDLRLVLMETGYDL